MNIDAVRAELAALLEVPVARLDTGFILADHANWDSLAMVSLVAFLVGETGGPLDVNGLDEVQTIADLWQLIGAPGESVAS